MATTNKCILSYLQGRGYDNCRVEKYLVVRNEGPIRRCWNLADLRAHCTFKNGFSRMPRSWIENNDAVYGGE